MKLERLEATQPLFEAAFSLYEASFPANERRTRADQLLAMHDAAYEPLVAVEQGQLLADVFLWSTPEFVYLEHFAVCPQLRGKGLGGALLEQLTQQDRPLILEIEPPENDICRRRKAFYERHGLCEQPYAHVQLPFQGGGPTLPLILMADRTISPELCQQFQAYLLARVVRYTQYRPQNGRQA